MIIKDKAFGKYQIEKTYKGISVLDETGKQVKGGLPGINEALQDIAERLTLDGNINIL